MIALLLSLVIPAIAQINNCEVLNNGTYCINKNIIDCNFHKQINSTQCPKDRSNGCLDIVSCNCINNWAGISCDQCPFGEVCADRKTKRNTFEWWEILLIVIGSIVGLIILGFIIFFVVVGCMVLCTFRINF